MKRIVKSAIHFLKRENGVTAIECALMLALIVVVCIVSINSVNAPDRVNEPVVASASR